MIALKTMAKVEMIGLPEEQWGGRVKLSSIDLGISKRIIIDYAKLTNKPVAIVDIDATACYDRIVHSIGVLAMASYGLHTKAIRWLLTMLEQMTYRKNIGKKQSEYTYPSKDDDIQGLGQDSAYAGARWMFTDAKIIEHYSAQAHPLLMTCPQEEKIVGKSSETFVDDSTLVTEAENTNT